MKWILTCMLLIAASVFVFGKLAAEPKHSFPERKEGFRNFVQINNETFYFGESRYTWYEARVQCNLLGMQMVTLDTQERWEMIRDWLLANSEYGGWTWTSGQKLAGETDFVWTTTGQTFNFTAWNNGEPSAPLDAEYCVEFWSEMDGWDDDGCARYLLLSMCETIK